MRVYVGFDDTDNHESDYGTGKLTRHFENLLPEGCSLWGVVRQQLLVDDRIPYTSHNSAACAVLEADDPSLMDQIIHHLKNSSHTLVVSHAKPDGDAIGSLIAMGLALDALNKKTTLYNESPIPAVYRFLPSVNRIVRHINSASFDIAVMLDCGDLERIGKAVSTVKQIPVIVNIDHHVTNTRFGHFQLIDTSACATAEILYRLIKQMGVPVDKAIATSIYTGILTDTGSFRFSNTNRFNALIAEAVKESLLEHCNKEVKLILDLEGVDFIDSSGFSVFLVIMKEIQLKDGIFRICNIDSEVMELFKMLQLHTVFELFDTLEECLQSFKAE